MNFDQWTALITGASGGIGEQFARSLAERGSNLILVARSADKLDAVRADILARHPKLDIDVLPADLSTSSAGVDLAARVRQRGRSVDLLINNAGFGSHALFLDEDPAAVQNMIALNIVTLTTLTRQLLPPMVAAGRGAVINVASTAAYQPVPTMAVYAATKAYVLSFTEAIWQETRLTGVRILALSPGATETGFFDRAGTQFRATSRQTPQQVVEAALKALESSAPSVVTGLQNKIGTLGYRLTPRRLMPTLARRSVKAN